MRRGGWCCWWFVGVAVGKDGFGYSRTDADGRRRRRLCVEGGSIGNVTMTQMGRGGSNFR